MQEAVIGKDAVTGELITIGDLERRSGLYLAGRAGFGKTETMLQLMAHAMEHGQGLFFLDPHGTGITDLISRIDTDAIDPEALGDSLLILDPEEEHYSFCINLLSCSDLTSLKQRTDTYTRAFSVFYKLWEDSWGPWLQLILQNVLYAFIESPECTLAEVPAFLDPRNTAFRQYIVNNIKHNPDVADFWRYEFFTRRERNQQERVDAALTRINTLLIHPYVRDIIGTRETTLDFSSMLERQQVVLVKLSANLSPDIKKFIGMTLLSELLYAVRNRPEGRRHDYGIFIDEVQNFAGSEDFTTLITEARKFGIQACICHVERYGQLGENKKLLGATAAAANKIFFQLIPEDARELGLEFARGADDTQHRSGGELIISPTAVEDLWEKGHPNPQIMNIRARYFWLWHVLRSKPHEPYFPFDPNSTPARPEDPGKLHWHAFADWEMYRSSADMLREGVALLDRFYYERMQQPSNKQPISDDEVQLIVKVLECFAGVLGWRPTMEAYIPDDIRMLFVRRLNEQNDRQHRDFVNETLMKHRALEQDARRWDRAHPYANWNERPPQGYPIPAWEVQQIIDEHKPKEWHVYDIPVAVAVEDIQKLRNSAVAIGFTHVELEHLLQWRIRQLPSLEHKALTELVKLVLAMPTDKERYEREHHRVYQTYTSVMGVQPMVGKFGVDHSSLPRETTDPYLKQVVERIVWQMTEMQYFLPHCFHLCPHILSREPVKLPSGTYEEPLTRVKTQGELIDEVCRELVAIPRFTAFAKIIREQGGEQVVVTRKIHTFPLPAIPRRYLTDPKYQTLRETLERNTIRAGACRLRDEIEAELRERWQRWRRIPAAASSAVGDGDEPPPTSEDPPPTSE